ncbi:unnamed protein product [Vitrella brassicaformis CCMP3155]|uniref:N-acetyltransferase domain-containing protein n=1 Tax=Vitrella brassicaformis (strain CCMP3155) TaxID=1169540 RepID=A0A0G4G8C5_VITBC|nr:unnamed protein product [Vitrella brassicaformis CCMP3155]|eukprot:CEM24599.1 unnamed protein product [Vitrella brassicaformis CCMP3155]
MAFGRLSESQTAAACYGGPCDLSEQQPDSLDSTFDPASYVTCFKCGASCQLSAAFRGWFTHVKPVRDAPDSMALHVRQCEGCNFWAGIYIGNRWWTLPCVLKAPEDRDGIVEVPTGMHVDRLRVTLLLTGIHLTAITWGKGVGFLMGVRSTTPTFMLWQRGIPMGFYSLAPCSREDEEGAYHTVTLLNVFVRPDRQRQGIGRQLIDHFRSNYQSFFIPPLPPYSPVPPPGIAAPLSDALRGMLTRHYSADELKQMVLIPDGGGEALGTVYDNVMGGEEGGVSSGLGKRRGPPTPAADEMEREGQDDSSERDAKRMRVEEDVSMTAAAKTCEGAD